MMNNNRFPAIILVVLYAFVGTCMVVPFSGCSDLDKYRKPATEEKTAAPVVEEKSVDIRSTPEERERGREFKIKLDAIRAEFRTAKDTVATITALDFLLVEVDAEWKALPQESEFGTFYLLIMADILNQVSELRQSLGDSEGALEAQQKLIQIRESLPR